MTASSSLPALERLTLQVAPGLEPVLLKELRALGLTGRSETGVVQVEGPAGSHRALNLRLRTAERVWLELGAIAWPPSTEALRSVPLSSVRGGEGEVAVQVSGEGSSKDLLRRVSEAWRVPLATAGDDETEPPLRLHFRFESGGRVRISADTTGVLLYRRGYRQETSRAPLRETLAAGLLSLAGYSGKGAVWDPMCGSGTVLLEAARWARRMAPGVDRSFAFERFPRHDAAAWEREREAARGEERPRAGEPLWGTDIHAGSLGVARRNGRRARVLEDLTLERKDATALPAAPAPDGWVVVNLPYGGRVGERATLDVLYRGFFASVKQRCAGWTLGVYAEDAERVERTASLAFSARHALRNGGRRCSLLVAKL